MQVSIWVRLQQIDWQLDLIRSDVERFEHSIAFVQLIYEAEGLISQAIGLLGLRQRDSLPFPHRYQERTPPPR